MTAEGSKGDAAVDIDDLERNWNEFGRTDPLWAILTDSTKQGNQWDKAEFFETGRTDVACVLDALKTLDVPMSSRAALDFGCGVGRLTQALGERFDTVTGIDIAASMIELARLYNQLGERCRYIHNTRPDLSVFPDASFDFILTLITLQHMEPRYATAYLHEFLRVLMPGGIVAFQIPSALPTSVPLKVRLRDQIPVSLLRLYYRLRYGRVLAIYRPNGGPVQELHAMRPDAVRSLIEQGGGIVLSAQGPDPGDSLAEVLYFAQKKFS